MKLDFKKYNNGWFIDLPLYPYNKSDLQMVYGADDFLDKICPNKNHVSLLCSLQTLEHSYSIELIREDSEMGGGWYKTDYEDFEKEFWLCDVVKYVFGMIPQKIFFKIVE